MSWILSEPRISFSALARREGVHLSTVWRWSLRGCKGHVLESFSIGGKKFANVARIRAMGRSDQRRADRERRNSPPTSKVNRARRKAHRGTGRVRMKCPAAQRQSNRRATWKFSESGYHKTPLSEVKRYDALGFHGK